MRVIGTIISLVLIFALAWFCYKNIKAIVLKLKNRKKEQTLKNENNNKGV